MCGAVVWSLGCAHITPGLVLSRLDPDKIVACARRQGMKARALCLGTHVASAALDAAVTRAAGKIEDLRDAANPHAGAADVSDRELRALARETDAAIRELEAIAAGGV